MGKPVSSAATFQANGEDFAVPTSFSGEWIRVVIDTTAGAVDAGVLLNPRSYSSDPVAANHSPLIVTMGTRVRFVCRYPSTLWVVWTSPQVRVFGADKIPDSAGTYPAGTIFWRLDDTTYTASSTTLTLGYPNDLRVDDNYVSTPITNSGYLLRGAKSVLVLTATAAINDNNDRVEVMAQVF